MSKLNIILLSACTALLAGGFIYKSSSVTDSRSTETYASTGAASEEELVFNPNGFNIGDTVPDISMYSPDSAKVYKLSDLKNHVVLLDFWASWCGPCRRENPTVVSAYRTYKDKKFKEGKKGFRVFSVSLDFDANNWKNAIAKDSLEWDEHVSDLKYWNNAAAVVYGINSIPYNYLINGDGVVIAKGLRGEQLISTLESLPAK